MTYRYIDLEMFTCNIINVKLVCLSCHTSSFCQFVLKVCFILLE